MKRLIKFIASFFYIGYMPVAPGTMGSFTALFLYYFLRHDQFLVGWAIFICILLGLLTAGKAEELLGSKDSGEIIIDEVAGMLISLYLLPASMGYIVSAFLLFRFFDIVKPFPINKSEKLAGSFGIMLDDILAGLYANIILQAFYRLPSVFRI